MVISIITAVRNNVRNISNALESVRRQVLPPGVSVEHIVIDAASTDGTLEKIQEFEKFHHSSFVTHNSSFAFHWKSGSDRGIYDGINKGISMATGDIVGLLHSDDALADDHVIADISAAFSGNVDAIYGDIRFVRNPQGGSLDDFWRLPTARFYSSRHWHRWMHNFGYMPAHPSIYIRREALQRVGLYNHELRISADFEWMVRAFCGKRGEKRVVRPVYLPRTIVEMSLGGASTKGLRAMLQLNRENVQANRDNGYPSCLLLMLPKYLFKIWGYVFTHK